ncbi:MAG: P1 family peptidase, partial [Actinomycetota bacterium]
MTTRPATTSPAPDPSAEPFGSITDVDGVGVGHHQRLGRGWQTGTTVVACGGGATPGCDVRGGGPGTRETDALRPENLVDRIHAVCLTGGSAFGLAAADGVMDELEGRGLGVPVGGDVVVPVVPTAVVFDLGRGGDHRNRPDATFGRRAAAAALGGRATMRWGAVGAGAGARSGAVQGGVGTASTTVRVEIPAGAAPVAGVESDSAPEHLADGVTFTVGALAVVNSHGSVIDPATVLPWERGPLRWPRPGAA